MATPGGAGRVRQVIAPVVEAAEPFLEDVVVDPVGRLSAALDAADPIGGACTLEVSSPGTSRPLTEVRHFRRATGRRSSASRCGTGRAAPAGSSPLMRRGSCSWAMMGPR
jgi:ribosome maturation factor RimP